MCNLRCTAANLSLYYNSLLAHNSDKDLGYIVTCSCRQARFLGKTDESFHEIMPGVGRRDWAQGAAARRHVDRGRGQIFDEHVPSETEMDAPVHFVRTSRLEKGDSLVHQHFDCRNCARTGDKRGK